MKQYYSTLFLFIITLFSKATITGQNIDTITINKLNKRAYNLINRDPEKADSIALYILAESKTINYIKGIIEANHALSILDYYDGRFLDAKDRIKKNINLCILHNSNHIASAYLGMGNIYQSLTKFDSSLYYYNLAQKANQVNFDQRKEAVINLNIGLVQHQMNNIPISLEHLFRSLRQFEKINNDLGQADCFINIATLYFYHKKNTKAIKYYKLALEKYRKLNNLRKLSSCLMNLAELKSDTNPEEAIIQFNEAANIYKQLDDNRSLAACYSLIGSLYINTDRPEKAIDALNSAYSIRCVLKDTVGMINTLTSIAKIHYKKGYNKRAINTIRTSAKLLKHNYPLETKANLYKNIAEIYNKSKIYDSAYLYLAYYNNIADSLYKKENLIAIEDALNKYELDKKDEHIQLQNQEIKLLEKEKRLNMFFIISIIIVFLIISFTIFYNYKKQKKERIKSNKLLKSNKILYKNNKLLTQQKMDLLNKEKEILRNQLLQKKNDLTRIALQINQKNEFLQAVKKKIKDIKTKAVDKDAIKDINSLMAQITNTLKLNEERNEFNELIENINADFLEMLGERYPDLTSDEKKLATYLKLNLSSKEMSVLFDISSKSVDMKRYRLRRKLNIDQETKLSTFFQNMK
ncbi:MAG: tetratricopeptide repeat protein [Hyphomicrobiales bacterium]